MGKGSKRRPNKQTEEHVQSEWDRIFGKSKSQQKRLKVQQGVGGVVSRTRTPIRDCISSNRLSVAGVAASPTPPNKEKNNAKSYQSNSKRK